MSLPTPLRASRVRALLPGQRFTRDLRVLGIVPSTSDLLSGLARAGAEDGLVLVAEEQTAGRGRRGTRWECPAGKGLLLSLLLRPAPTRRELLPATLGVALCRAVATLDLPARVKWPNDVLVAGRKVGGCIVDLAEDHAVVGIGLNANLDEQDLLSDAPLPAASLSLLLGRRMDREELLAAVLRETEAVLDSLARGEEHELLAAYARLDALPGAAATVRVGDRLLDGTVVETDPLQGLLLRRPDGATERLRPEHAHVLALRFADED